MRKFELKNISLRYQDQNVLENINMCLERGKVTSLIGISGSGKSTILKILIKLIEPTEGSCVWNFDEEADITSTVFQNNTLLPWKTVKENLSIAGDNGCNESEIIRISKKVGLFNSLNKYPNELSGGMLQRLELGRVLIRKPHNIFFDEPFNSLDVQHRKNVHKIIEEIKDLLKPTMLLITHDIDEAWKLADNILVLSGNPTNSVHEFIDVKNNYCEKRCIEMILEKEFNNN